ncbi:MAG: hypothetical protein HRT74_14440, partial [Flavobacteriales bacterium]|nr:hypothetical protein [Flavobacteriales bacterium]
MKALKALNKYFWKYKWRLLLGFAFIILTNLLAVFSPLVIKEGVNILNDANKQYYVPIAKAKEENPDANLDKIFEEGNLNIDESAKEFVNFFGLDTPDPASIVNTETLGEALIILAILLALLYIVVHILKGVFLFFTRQTIIVMSRLIEYDLKNEIYDQYQRLHMGFYKRNNTGDLMNRISEDVSKVRMYLGPAVMYTLNLTVLIVLVVYMMSRQDLELTLYSLLPLPFMSIGIYYVSSIINRRSERVQEQQSDLSTMVQESMSGIRVLKAYHREAQNIQSFKQKSDTYKTRVLNLVKV